MANILNQVIDQGATYSRQITVLENDGTTIQNLTEWTVTAQIRKNYTSTNYTTINATKVEPQTNGKITMSLTATDTAGMKAGRYVYDLEIKKSDEVRRIIEGVITIRPEVTKPEA
tara:strand:- start:194 stop:538 length:345 start_codon:yes stop_codon:yes gene_type:complete